MTTLDNTITPGAHASFLATSRGRLTLALLCAVAFLDFLDASIVNVALPTVQHDLRFSIQNLQWVLSGYVLTYGGFLLLGGRAADLLGRRRVLVAGTVVFAGSSLAAGLAPSAGLLVAARLTQGLGAALMSPAALSILTTSFNHGTDRLKALGAWAAMAGVASAVGVFLGGLLASGPGWRWVFFVNLPVCVVVVAAALRLINGERHRVPLSSFDTPGAILGTGTMLLLVHALVRAPQVGWGSNKTTAELAGALIMAILFVINEQRHRNPLVPLSIFRIRGLAAADATQMIAVAGFYSMFFFITLYMQEVLGYSPIRAGAAYVPVAVGVALSSGLCAKLFARTGTRPVIVAGAVVSAGAVFWLSRIPVHGSYLTDLLPGLLIMSFGLGAVFVGVQTAANAGVPPDKAGLAAALIATSFQVGAALGLAIFSAVATSHTHRLLAGHASRPVALTLGFQRALVACSIFLVAAALIALRATNTRGEPTLAVDEGVMVGDGQRVALSEVA
jgi:EmrB/QacA subfamily drug resistance transporter